MMHISLRSIVSSRMSRRCYLLQRTQGGYRDGGRGSSLCLNGWASSWSARKLGGLRRPGVYGYDEVESLRPDASLTMSNTTLLATSSASTWFLGHVVRIRAMHLKSLRRRCSCTYSRMQISTATRLTGSESQRGLANGISSRRGIGLQQLLMVCIRGIFTIDMKSTEN